MHRAVLCCAALCCFLVVEGSPNKTFTLWLGSPFGFWGGPFNQTKLSTWLQELDQIKSLVDTVSVPTYFLRDPSNQTAVRQTGGLVAGQNIELANQALKKAGYTVTPLVGNFYGTNNITWYRYYMAGPGRAGFLQAASLLVSKYSLDGLNIDFEPSADSCTRTNPPCSDADATHFAAFLTDLKKVLQQPGGRDAIVSVDTGQSIIAKTPILHTAAIDRLITMNTYGDTADFDIALPRDLLNDGPEKFGLGVCPGCFNSSVADIKHRIDEATRLGVRHIAYWAGANIPHDWLDALTAWKSTP